MSVYQKSNSKYAVKALAGRIEDVIMGYPLDSARTALVAVLALVAAQTLAEPEALTAAMNEILAESKEVSNA